MRETTFLRCLGATRATVSNGAALRVLANIGLGLSTSTLAVANDGSSVSVRAVLSVTSRSTRLAVRRPNDIILPTEFFNRVIGHLPRSAFALAIGSHFRAAVISNTSRFAVGNIRSRTCPRLPRVSSGSRLGVPNSLLGRVVSRAMVTASGRRGEPVLAKVRLAVGRSRLATITASSRELDRQGTALRGGTAKGCSVLIPNSSLDGLDGVLKRARRSIRLRVSRGRILFVLSRASFCSHLLRNRCPGATRLVPGSTSAAIRVSTRSLLHSVRHTSLLSRRKRGGIIHLIVSPTTGATAVFNGSPRVNGIRRILSFGRVRNSRLRVSFGPSCVGSTLRTFKRDRIGLGFALPLHPFAVIPSRSSNSFVRLVAPIEAT